MTSLDKVKEQFASKGYIEIHSDKYTRNLLWQPDIILSKDKFVYLVLFKTNNTVPPAYLNRIADTPKDSIIPLIIFSQKPSSTDEKLMLSLGLSIGYYSRGRLTNLRIKKKVSSRIIRKEIRRKLDVIDVFVSSRQDTPEREFVAERIEFLRKTRNFPFNPAHLIEHDKFKLSELYKHIDTVMGNCEWAVIILEDGYSDVVSYEIRLAVRELDHDNIFMFVKSTNACRIAWSKELNKVKKLESKSIKFLPYSDVKDLEVWLTKAIDKRINEICMKKKITIFV